MPIELVLSIFGIVATGGALVVVVRLRSRDAAAFGPLLWLIPAMFLLMALATGAIGGIKLLLRNSDRVPAGIASKMEARRNGVRVEATVTDVFGGTVLLGGATNREGKVTRQGVQSRVVVAHYPGADGGTVQAARSGHLFFREGATTAWVENADPERDIAEFYLPPSPWYAHDSLPAVGDTVIVYYLAGQPQDAVMVGRPRE